MPEAVEMNFDIFFQAVSNEEEQIFVRGGPRGEVEGAIDEDIGDGFEFFFCSIFAGRIEGVVKEICELISCPDLGGKMAAIVDGLFEDVLDVRVVALEFILTFMVVFMGIYEKNNHLRILFII